MTTTKRLAQLKSIEKAINEDLEQIKIKLLDVTLPIETVKGLYAEMESLVNLKSDINTAIFNCENKRYT